MENGQGDKVQSPLGLMYFCGIIMQWWQENSRCPNQIFPPRYFEWSAPVKASAKVLMPEWWPFYGFFFCSIRIPTHLPYCMNDFEKEHSLCGLIMLCWKPHSATFSRLWHVAVVRGMWIVLVGHTSSHYERPLYVSWTHTILKITETNKIHLKFQKFCKISASLYITMYTRRP